MLSIIDFTDDVVCEWDKLVKNSPDGWPWALSNWRSTILNVDFWELQDLSFAISDGCELLAVMPLQYSRLSHRLESTGMSYCGPILSSNLGPKQRKKVLSSLFMHTEKLAQACGATMICFGMPPVTQASLEAPWGVNPYVGYGFTDESGLSRIIDLRPSAEVLFRNYSETARHAIAKAKRLGYSVECVNWLDYLDAYYEVHTQCYHRTGVTPHPKSYFEGIARNMATSGYAVLWCCKNSTGLPVAFHNTCCFGRSAYYHTGCSLDAHLPNGVNYLLMHTALLEMKSRGTEWYECGEVFPDCYDTKNKLFGLTTFKTKFGGENHRYFICRKDLRPLNRKRLLKDFIKSGYVLLKSFVPDSN